MQKKKEIYKLQIGLVVLDSDSLYRLMLTNVKAGL